MKDASARELIDECANSASTAAWLEFRRRFEPRIRNGIVRAYRRTGRRPMPEWVDDLVQESYCKLLERRGRALSRCSGTEDPEIGAYLGRVAERLTFDHLRAEAAKKRGAGRVDSLDAMTERRGRCWLGVAARAEERLLFVELQERFRHACLRAAGERPERNLRILRLALVDGLTSREISRRLDDLLSVSGIDAVVHRLRKRLATEGFFLQR